MATPAVGDAAIAEAVAYVLERGYARVTLQFPDELLGAAPAAAARLQAELAAARSDAKVYVLADTTYNPLSVDEVAAQHVGADCVVRHTLGRRRRRIVFCLCVRQISREREREREREMLAHPPYLRPCSPSNNTYTPLHTYTQQH